MDALTQAKNLITRSRDILILPSPDFLGDSLASALALSLSLRKLGKKVNALGGEIPEKFQFLTGFQPKTSQDFVIAVNCANKEINEMRYEKHENNLKIYLSLSRGEIKEEDVSFSHPLQNPRQLNPDLLITLGMQSRENLESFYETPVLNIDNQPTNENFGEVNLVDLTCSLAESTTELIKIVSLTPDLIDEDIATCLLTGVIWASQNFRNPKTRPKTFEVASELIEKGARHQEIIQHLYKQKTVSQIKVLGKILGKLSFEEEKEVYSALLTAEDLKACQASPRDLAWVVEELKFNFRHLTNLLLLWESHGSLTLIKGIFYSPRPVFIEKILKNFEGTAKGEGVLFLVRDNNLDSAKEKVLKVLS